MSTAPREDVGLRPTRCLCGACDVRALGCKDGRPVGACRACGLVRTCGVPARYSRLYTVGERYHSGRDGHVSYRDRFAHDSTVADLRWPKLMGHLRLLDVGCANGAFVDHAARQGMAAEGLEPNPAMAAWARQQCGRTIHLSWSTVHGRFDVITYHDVIEHVRDPARELRRARRHLRRGGLLVLDTPDADDPGFSRLGLSWHHMKPREHLWFFAEEHLLRLVGAAGFHVESVDRPIPGKLVLYARSALRTRRC
jgi:2-polyprenyl-3-methyl-5-hydroxy-6-metoxy-1,4-benzoquinol methylase